MYSKLSQLHVETERLFIRPAIRADLPAFYEMHRVEEVNRFLPYNTWLSWDDAQDWFSKVQKRRQKKDCEQYVLERKHDHGVIGSCIVFGK